MTKLLQNKSLIKFLGIALSILLIVALVPQINVAYGSKDDVATDEVAAETQPDEETDLADTGETEEGEDAAAETYTDENGVEMVSHKIETPEDDSDPAAADAAAAAPQADDPEADTPESPKVARTQSRTVLDPSQANIVIDKTTDYTASSPLKFNGGAHILTINEGCTFKGDILIKGGAQVTINGSGTIKGTGKGSVIIVDGSTLILGEQEQASDSAGSKGPTITGGTGSWCNSPDADEKVWALSGGGILVRKSSNGQESSFTMNSGVIDGNRALTGGGILIGKKCRFVMNGGKVSNNRTTLEVANNDRLTAAQLQTAKNSAHEGGGIFYAGSEGEINAGYIEGNETQTTFDWGGGGIFVNAGTKLVINSALITGNTAQGLGGGISGCPHAAIGIGTLTNGAAIYGNTASGTNRPSNDPLSFLTTKSVVQDNDKVGVGDFLALGIVKNHTHGGKTALAGNYAKNEFKASLAQDFYCTLASYVSATDLESHTDGIAWKGYMAGVPADKDNKTENMVASTVTIPVGESFVAADASLGLTSTAKADNTGINRTVIIRGNSSSTHGGGVGCNGSLEFGNFDKKEVVNSYDLSLGKKLVSANTGKKIDLKAGEFTFKLSNGKETYQATNDTEGNIIFGGLKGKKKSATETFTLTEELTDEQKGAGYSSTIPESGIPVTVTLKVEKKVTTGSIVTTYYTTTPSSVKIGNTDNLVITNTLQLKTDGSLPVTKIADGIPAGIATFNLKEVTNNIDSLVDQSSAPTTLKSGVDLAAIASNEPDQTKTIEMPDSVQSAQTATTAFKFDYKPQSAKETHWYVIAEAPDNAEGVSYDSVTYLAKIEVNVSEDGRSLTTSKPLCWKIEAGSNKLKSVGNDGVVFKNVAMAYEGFSLGLTKQILTTLGANLNLNSRTFNFVLCDDEKEVASGESDASTGKTSLVVADGNYAKQAYEASGGQKTFTFTLKETATAEYEFMATIPDATVEVTLSTTGDRVEENGRAVFRVTPKVESVTVNGTDVTAQVADITVTNRYTPNGTWQFTADKYFYGLGEPQGEYSFTMQEVERAPEAGEALSTLLVENDSLEKQTKTVEASAFNEGKAAVAFDPIQYKVEAPKAQDADEAIPTDQDDRGNHYYLVTEDGDGVKDTTAYVVKVTVAVDETDKGKLVAKHEVLGYADDLDSPFIAYTEKESTSEHVAFYNSDTFGMVSAASYSVYAASGEPADQVCYVDPKIHKNLEGRAIKSGEFAFKLIEVNNYTDTEGTQISATVNDEFGMVDFDKANPVNGDLENPSCLAYTKPGTYYYRVIEDTSKGGMKDQSVLYSDQIITFTTVIEQDEATGQLQCTDMYYGYWDAAAGKNVRFDEQYLDYDKQPANIGDMSKLNPDWHPTITNKTRPMDLQVRKTSVTDRNEGLVGATYALYMVNSNAQGDIYLTEATSEEGGWITYKNVSLSTNNLYYFKETAAPAGHTVSEFRSPYFYLVEDASSANGYALKYTDTKALPADAAAQPAALAETGAEAQPMAAAAEAQAAANETATDPNAQPGYSADGSILLTYDKDGGVADEATELQVSKLDTRTHEWVEGAELLILEKDTGKEIARWTSGKAPEKLQKTLNVGTTYILREFKAPKDYRLANDVEFVIDNYGNVSVTKGTENGNAELSDNTINLYDTMMDAEEVVTQQREKTREVPAADTLLAKTGDMLPLLGIGIVALAALVVLAIAIRRRRAEKGDDTQA